MKIKRVILLLTCLMLSICTNYKVSASSYITEGDIGFDSSDRYMSKKFSYIQNQEGINETGRFILEYNGEEVKDRTLSKRYYIGGTTGRIFSIFRDFDISGNTITYFEFHIINFERLTEEEVVKNIEALRKSSIYKDMPRVDRENITELIGLNSNLPESVLLESMFGEIKPDLVGGFRFYKPFEGIIGTSIALMALIIVLLLTVNFVIDIAYMILPEVNRDASKPKFISLVAYKGAKELSMGDSTSAQVLCRYLVDRLLNVSVLVICLLYLIGGKIFSILLKIMSFFA